MIKTKILTALIAASILFVIKPVFIHHYFTVSAQTTAKAETMAEIRYKTSDTGQTVTQTKLSNRKGNLTFYLPEQQLHRLSLHLENDIQTRSIFINGEKTTRSFHTPELTFPHPLAGRVKTDWFKAIVVFFLSWYLLYFPFSFQKNKQTELLPAKPPKMMNIEFLRIVFTLCVVTCHIFIPLKIWSNTRYCVEFFFILSGFFLTVSFNQEKTTASFMIQKICRFWPLVVFGALTNCLFVRKLDGSKLLSDIFFLSDILNKQDGYNGPAWYICVMFWVSLFYFGLFKTQKKGNINLIIGLCLFWSLSILVDASFSGGKIRIFRGIAGIGMGYFVALAYQQLSALPVRRCCLFSIVEAALLTYCLVSLFDTRIFPGNVVFIMIAFAVLILLFSLKVGAVSRFLERPLFAGISKYCPAVYLTHGILSQSIVPIFMDKYAVYMKTHSGLSWLVFTAAACILGIISHYMIEKPGQRLLSNGFKHLIKQSG